MCGLRDDDRDEVSGIKGKKFHLDYGADAKLAHFERTTSIHGKTRALLSTCVIHDAILSRAIITRTRVGFM